MTGEQVPVFELYGEKQRWPTPDLIHSETINERSRLHNWDIKPHRHSGLWHLVYFMGGTAEVELDEQHTLLPMPCILLVPEMCVHGFHHSEDIEGFVLTLASPLVRHLEQRLGVQAGVLTHSTCCPLPSGESLVGNLFSALHGEYLAQRPGRELLMESIAASILIWVYREALKQGGAPDRLQDKNDRYLLRFTDLLEEFFKTQQPIQFYAERIGVTPARLNTLCRRLAGRTALQMLHERLLLEAKRNLTYTSMTISEVSFHLGFSEPAYFTRFFKRMTGQSPSEFRQQGSKSDANY
ncbi:helix-turn-helix domain-containing protein [Marinimicrobium alkaliphilum]|uniref:helix-turn-helix domain-containing protein n=1 Tax=Marinimicrobium alkaliphilum TaxID=2202654 RepID=UPI001E526BF2|nr:helix-turn-helix domain-containing protein [Marinimicrobium alkaliphilum]